MQAFPSSSRLGPRIAATPRLLLLLGLSALALTGCGDDSGPSAKAGVPRRGPVEFPVEVEPARARSVDYTVSAVGSIEAFERVQVVARVPGAVEKVRFAEGDDVAPGQILVEIEPERYGIEVESARATTARAEAELADARAILERREGGNADYPGLFPVEDVDTYRTRVRVAEATVAAQRANQARADLNLKDARVRAPVAGKIETRTAQTGQYVQPGAVLATLVRREPLLLRFSVPEPAAASLHPGMRAEFRVPGTEDDYVAELTHVTGYADPASRMVAVTAHVVDPRRSVLRPGSFAEVHVGIGRSGETPVIPETAIRPSERGFLAFVIEDGVARERQLVLGLRTADGRVEVRSGLAAGEALVVRGAEALQDGVRVRVEANEAAPAAEATP